MNDNVSMMGSLKDSLDVIGVSLNGQVFARIVSLGVSILNENGLEEFRYADLRFERPKPGKLVVFRHDKTLTREREIVLDAEFEGNPIESIDMLVFRSGDWVDVMLAIEEVRERGITPDELIDLRERFNPLRKRNKSHDYEDDLLWNVIQQMKTGA